MLEHFGATEFNMAHFLILIGALASALLFLAYYKISPNNDMPCPICQILLQVGSSFAAASFALIVVLAQFEVDAKSKENDKKSELLLKLNADYIGNQKNNEILRSKLSLVHYKEVCQLDLWFKKIGRFDHDGTPVTKLNEREIEFIKRIFSNQAAIIHRSDFLELIKTYKVMFEVTDPGYYYYLRTNHLIINAYFGDQPRIFKAYLENLSQSNPKFVSDDSLVSSELDELATSETLVMACKFQSAMLEYYTRLAMAQAVETTIECYYLSAIEKNDKDLQDALKNIINPSAKFYLNNTTSGDNGIDIDIITDKRFFSTLKSELDHRKKCYIEFFKMKDLLSEDPAAPDLRKSSKTMVEFK